MSALLAFLAALCAAASGWIARANDTAGAVGAGGAAVILMLGSWAMGESKAE